MDENNGGIVLDEIEYTTPRNRAAVASDITRLDLDDFGYTAPTGKKGAPTGVDAPVLDDMDVYNPDAVKKKGAPTGVTAPVLDDDTGYVPLQQKKKEVRYMSDDELIASFSAEQLETFNRLPEASKKTIFERMRQQLGVEAPPEPEEEIKAPILDDMSDYVDKPRRGMPVLDDSIYEDEPKATEPEPEEEEEPVKYMTDEEIIERFTPEQLETYNRFPEANRKAVLAHMRQQLGVEAPPEPVEQEEIVSYSEQVEDYSHEAAPVEEKKPEPVPEPKPESPKPKITAPILDDEPETPVYKPKFVDEDLERAKREGAKQAVSSQLVSDQKDSKESLRMMLELKEERRREMAKQGFKWVILLAVVGIVAAAAFYLLYSGSLGLDYKDGIDGIAGIIKDCSLYITVAMGGTALAMVSGIGFFKSLASTVFMLSGIAQIFPGVVMISQHEGSMGLAVALYVVALVCTIVVFGSLSAVESISLYFKRNEL